MDVRAEQWAGYGSFPADGSVARLRKTAELKHGLRERDLRWDIRPEVLNNVPW
jgi:hypothetical protein